MIHQKLLVPLTAVVMTGVGWWLHDFYDSGSAGRIGSGVGKAPSSQPTKIAGVDAPGSPQAERKRPMGSPTKSPERGRIHRNVDGSITISPQMLDRLRIKVLDEGKVNREELALLGVDVEKADQLQALADSMKDGEKARQTRVVKVLRDGEDGTTLLVPASGGSEGELRQVMQDKTQEILGPDSELAADSFMTGLGEITRSWAGESLIVDTRLSRTGKREYRVYSYREGYGFTPPEGGAVDLAEMADKAFGMRTYFSEKIPDDLKHLFK